MNVKERPRDIILFEALFFASLLFGIFRLFYILYISDIAFHTIEDYMLALFPFIFVFTIVIMISRRRIRFAVWIIFLLYTIGLPFIIYQILTYEDYFDNVIIIVQLLLQGAGCLLLFTPDSKSWLRGDPARSNDYGDIFS